MTCADEVHRVSADLYVWQAYEPEVKCDLTSTALRVGDALILIDPIWLEREGIEELLDAGEPKLIVCTNVNHARAAARWRKGWGAQVVAHEEAGAELEVEVDVVVKDGDDLGALVSGPAAGRLEICALPGGANGEIAIIQPGRLACLGDAVVHLPGHGFGVLPDKYCNDAKLLRTSLQKLLRWEFQALTFAHGLPLLSQARERLSDLLV